MLAASAAFALFVVLGIIILGFVIFAVLWIKAKITGKPIMASFVSKSTMQQFETFNHMQKEASEFKEDDRSGTAKDGPVIDAHETPDGWSVDTE